MSQQDHNLIYRQLGSRLANATEALISAATVRCLVQTIWYPSVLEG